MTDMQVGEYTPDDDLKLHRENAIKLICSPFQSHEAGYPEWAKNAADEYARTDAPEEDRVVVLIMQNGRSNGPSTTIACLDFSGMASGVIDDEFRHWADPDASRRDGDENVEVQGGHGNGGKCYMTQMFEDRAYLHTVKSGLGSVYGTVGGSIHLGYFPNRAEGKDFPVTNVKAELARALGEFGLGLNDLPAPANATLEKRQGFTLMVGRGAKGYGPRVPTSQMLEVLVEHPQMRMTLEMCSVYAVANKKVTAEPLSLSVIPPLPGVDGPRIISVPHTLVDPVSCNDISTTNDGAEPLGSLALLTSETRMWRGAKKSRHNIVYKAKSGYIGYRPVSDFDGYSSYRDRIYGQCDLLALEPAKMNDRAALANSPLSRALENWIGEEIEKYAKEFEAQDRRKHDQEEKDALAEINAALDNWKNELLDKVLGNEGGGEGPGTGPKPPPPPLPTGVAARIELSLPFYRAGVGVAMQPKLTAFDASDNPIRPPAVMWTSSDDTVATVDDVIRVIDTYKPGQAVLQCQTFDKSVASNTVSLEVVDIASITLDPNSIELPVGSRRRITATCQLTSGDSATDVALAWLENDPSIAKVSASGSVFGFTEGSTEVTASDDRVVADNVVAIEVVPGESDGDSGSAYPRVLVSEIDRDPDTDEHVVLKSDDPPVHQLPYDYDRNVWWINSASPLAALYLSGDYGPASREWRIYHTERYVDVIVQIAMSQGPEAEDTLDVGEWLARWGERAADIQSEVVRGLKSFILDGELPS